VGSCEHGNEPLGSVKDGDLSTLSVAQTTTIQDQMID
jgi:hypothetical protein